MLKKTFPYLNYKYTSHVRQLPHILKINLHTKLDDGKDLKCKIDDKTKGEIKENIKNELKKDLKCEIDDRTKNELKENIKNELEKDLKCEIDDRTKNELKENIKNELEKDLKCEIDDRTKNELKENIKNELEKDLKFEISDKTKDEIKDKIKKEIEDEIDYKRDKDGFNKDGYDKDGFDKNGFDKDGFNKDGYDKDGFDKNGFDKDGYDKEGYDKEGYDKEGYDKEGYDKDGFNEKGYNRNGYDKDGFNEDGYNRNSYDKDGYNKDGYDRDGKNKDGKVTEDKNKPDIVEGDKDEVKVTAFIRSQEITPDHADHTKCGAVGSYYKTYNQVGRQGFSTSDLLEAFYPEMYSNLEIAEHLKMGAKSFYGAVNYKFAFSEPFDYSWANASNMWCKKCADAPQEIACQGNEAKSFCYPAGYYANQDYSQSFFAEKSCPNLIKVSGTTTIKAKQVAPLILVNSSGQMIDKEGNNTQISYSSLSPYLKANGHMKDCAGDAKCKSFAEIMKKVAWDSDKKVLLKTVFDDAQKTNPYYYDNEDNSISVDTDFI